MAVQCLPTRTTTPSLPTAGGGYVGITREGAELDQLARSMIEAGAFSVVVQLSLRTSPKSGTGPEARLHQKPMQRTHSEPKAEQEPQAFSDTFSSQQLAVEGTRQLREDQVRLRENLQEISERNHQINDLKIEQVLTLAGLKEVTMGQTSLIDQLKARLEDRATGARRP
ncbi:uncharacterized protein FFB14_13432 [Fusarium fujikuroi]|nr:uncharacterized protein FFB14_13432 [Fusarium fujikuroi]